MNSALITNEMSGEEGEGALDLSSLAWDLKTRETVSLGTSQWIFSVHPRKEPVQISHSIFIYLFIYFKTRSAEFLENE